MNQLLKLNEMERGDLLALLVTITMSLAVISIFAWQLAK